ncbi:hypothetical protein Tco_1525686 [Tanacetum coccineum]
MNPYTMKHPGTDSESSSKGNDFVSHNSVNTTSVKEDANVSDCMPEMPIPVSENDILNPKPSVSKPSDRMQHVIENGPCRMGGLHLLDFDVAKSLGKSLDLRAKYALVTPLCVHCKTFGHFTKVCSKNVDKVDESNANSEVKSNINSRKVNEANDNDGWQNMNEVSPSQKQEARESKPSKGMKMRKSQNDDMMEFFLARCEEITSDEINGHYNEFGGSSSLNEVEEESNGAANFMVQNVISNDSDASMTQVHGLTQTSKQDEVKLLIREEAISMCAIIETRLRKKSVNSVCENVNEDWLWVLNAVESRKGCRIIVGWDRNVIGANLIIQTDQDIRRCLEILVEHIFKGRTEYSCR